ncbi:cullin-5-like isoform X2 [Paramacrobiotus metropolitanus]|nr:cullin-5-like isoform X2 [Paramacrobiotus metropolitanus]XP_055355401.1 cullin-5-like isoform X2 [Paramacrobiotus metropolitanus]XP_055355409.1 cullin-5-like isoform X2 [Paramacrobiotus metropolitanus]
MALGSFNFGALGLAENADVSDVFERAFNPTFVKLLSQTSVPKAEWQHLFFTVYKYVIWFDDADHVLATKLYQCLRTDVEQCAQSVAEYINEEDDRIFLEKYVKRWNDFYVQSSHAPLPFHSVDTALLEQTDFARQSKHDKDSMKPIQRMMLQVWQEIVLTPLATRLLKIVADMLNVEREGGFIFGDLIVGVRDSFLYVSASKSFFEQNYEQVYISSLERYFMQAATSRFTTGNVVEYSTWAEQTFHDEHARAKKYLSSSPKYKEPVNRMNERLVEILIQNPQIYDAVSNEACRLVEERRSEPLSVLYQLLDRVPEGLEPLIAAVQAYIVRKGKDDMLESASVVASDPEKYVEKLLGLFRSFSQLIIDAFNEDHRFTSARDRGFQEVVNDTSVFSFQLKGRTGNLESRCPEMLANFCDSLLRKTALSRRLGSEEIAQRLKSTLQVLKYVSSKDIFMQFYQNNLARRLLLGLSVDSDLEEEMSKWLANVGMPAEIISRINRMFMDIRISEDLSRAWQEYASGAGLRSRNGEIDPKVLNVCSWSKPGERTACAISPEVEEFIVEFEKWYCERYQGRKLVLAGNSSNMVIQFESRMGTYELEVTMFQWAVLKAFKDCGKAKLGFEAVQMATGLPLVELKRTLWTLCTMSKCGNQVMGFASRERCDNQGIASGFSAKDIDKHTVFWLNMNFAPVRAGRPQRRGRINLIGKLQIGSDRSIEEDQEGIAVLRELRVQEAITKVMKTRKTASMTEIHTETIELLKNLFVPTRKVLKEQIEYLIEKEYISRDERDFGVFHYVA